MKTRSMRMLSTPGRTIQTGLLIAGLLGAILIPWHLVEQGTLYTLTQIVIAGIFASAVAFVIGFAGVPTFGNQLFYGAGAYIVAYYSAVYGMRENFVALLAAFVFGATLALLVSSLLRGSGGFPFGMLTLAVAQTGYLFAFQTQYLRGADGISGVQRGTIFGISVRSAEAYYVYCLAVGIVCVAGIVFLRRSMAGRMLVAIKDSRDRAIALGIPAHRYQMFAFAVGGAVSGVAGVLSAQLIGAVDPTGLYWTTIATPLLGSLIGGIGTVAGPILGAAIYVEATFRLSLITVNWILWVGIIVLVMALLAPEGLVPGLKAGMRFVNRRAGLFLNRRSAPPPASEGSSPIEAADADG